MRRHLPDGDGQPFRSRIDEKNAVGRWRGERGHVGDMADGRASEGPRLAVLAVEAILAPLAPVSRQADVGRDGREGLEASRLLLPVGELYPEVGAVVGGGEGHVLPCGYVVGRRMGRGRRGAC